MMNTSCHLIIIVEEMVSGLQQVSWRRVDVSFVGATSRFMAHNTIQVKNTIFNMDLK